VGLTAAETVTVASTQTINVMNARQTPPLKQVATVDLLKKIPSPLRNQRVRGGVSNYQQLEYRLSHIKPFPITPIITVYEETFNIIGSSTSIFCNNYFTLLHCFSVRRTYGALATKWQAERFLWHAAFASFSFFYLFCPTSVPIW
jgi:hypothetical protein